LCLPIHLDHPVVQASVRVAHDVIQNDQLLQLFPERLLQGRRPDKIAGPRCGGLWGSFAVITLRVVDLPSRRSTVVGPSLLLFPVRIVGPESGEVLVWPGVFAEKDVGVFESREEDLETPWLRGQELLVPRKVVPVPEGVVKGLGGQVDHVGVWHHVCSQLGIEDVGCRLADVGQVGNETAGKRLARGCQGVVAIDEENDRTHHALPKQQGNRFR